MPIFGISGLLVIPPASGGPPPIIPEYSFGIDWDLSDGGPNDSGSAVAASAVTTRNFNVTLLPNNAVALIRFSFIYFQTSGDGVVNILGLGQIAALRNNAGDLSSSINSFNGASCGAGGTIPPTLAQVSDVITPDANTVQIQVTNLTTETGFIKWRWGISFITAGNPLGPFPP